MISRPHRRFVINLDRSADRLSQFRTRNAHVPDIERMPAVDGHALDRGALVAQGYITDDLPYGPGTLGCAMSHIRLWKLAASGNMPITIFEDDAVICRAFDDISARSLDVLGSSWDIVRWGLNFNPSFVWVRIGLSAGRIEGYGPSRDDELEHFIAERKTISLVRLLHGFGACAYSISPSGARQLLDRCLPLHAQMVEFANTDVAVENTSHDIVLCGIYPDLAAFVCLDPLVVPDPHTASVRISTDAV